MTSRTAFYYDNRGNLERVLDPDDGLTYYGYDDDHRLTSVQDPAGNAVSYDYSPGGRVVQRTLSNGGAICYSYDTVGQVSKVDNRASDRTVISRSGYECVPAGVRGTSG